MKLNKENHLKHVGKMINPEQRAAYYKNYIDPNIINLSTAENILLLKFYQEKAFNNPGMIEDKDIRYPESVFGSKKYRESIEEFLRNQWKVQVNSNNIFAVSGVSAALECLAFALFNEGDEVLIPAPMWYGFPWSFCQRPKMKFIPFNVSENFNLTKSDVQRALEQNPNAKLLVLTNPNNPLGHNYNRDLLEEIYTLFLEDENRHIISDEIYACSQVRGSEEFTSALDLEIYDRYKDRIHVVWGLSKDFGLSGFRVGFIVSQSPQVKRALEGDECQKTMAWFSPFGSLNQYMLKRLFLGYAGESGPKLAEEAMLLYKGLLEKQYAETARRLKEGNIRYTPDNNGAIFFWIDLREYLDRVPVTAPKDTGCCSKLYPELCPTLYSYDDPRERRLACYILKEAGIQLIRGQECFCEEPGYFRLCYTAENLEQVTQGIDKMARALETLPLPAE